MPATLAKFLIASSSGTSSITISGMTWFVGAARWALVGDGAVKIRLRRVAIPRATGRLGFVRLFFTVLLDWSKHPASRTLNSQRLPVKVQIFT